MDQSFTKTFEDEYNLSRELALLNDLGQRAAPVPRVLASDHRALTITMEHRGQSLAQWTHELPDDQVMVCLGAAIAGFDRVARMGVFHVDVAARNVLLESASAPKAQIIDFAAALCSRFPLQKPLWLRVNPSLHHPTLAQAIEDDWEQFFKSIGRPGPGSFIEDFDIPWEHYSQYWPATLAVNGVNHLHAVLAYGLAGLVREVGRSLATDGRERLEAVAQELADCQTNADAQRAIGAATRALSSDNATPMPRAQRADTSPTARPASASPKESGRAINTYGSEADGSITEGRRSKWAKEAESEGTQRSVVIDELPWLTRALLAALPLLGLWLTDYVYQSQVAVLGNNAFYSALVCVPIVVLLLVSLTQSKGLNLQRVSMLVLAFLQFVLAQDLWPQAGAIWAALTLVPGVIGIVGVIAPRRRPID